MRVARLQLSVNKRKRELCVSIILFDVFFVPCDSAGIRTLDPQIRNLLLYPTELRNLSLKQNTDDIFDSVRIGCAKLTIYL